MIGRQRSWGKADRWEVGMSQMDANLKERQMIGGSMLAAGVVVARMSVPRATWPEKKKPKSGRRLATAGGRGL
jgi:hypothetical protein